MQNIFRRAFAATCKHEGGYVHDPDDPGGETYMGISRRWHPDWHGWTLIRDLRAAGQALGLSNDLTAAVKKFYRTEFWHRIAGDEVAATSPDVAIEMFDTAVNLSPADATRYLQEALNLLNVNGTLWPDIIVDGKIGRVTLNTLTQCCGSQALLRKINTKLLLNVLNTLQGSHYIKQMRQYPDRERFRGWFARL